MDGLLGGGAGGAGFQGANFDWGSGLWNEGDNGEPEGFNWTFASNILYMVALVFVLHVQRWRRLCAWLLCALDLIRRGLDPALTRRLLDDERRYFRAYGFPCCRPRRVRVSHVLVEDEELAGKLRMQLLQVRWRAAAAAAGRPPTPEGWCSAARHRTALPCLPRCAPRVSLTPPPSRPCSAAPDLMIEFRSVAKEHSVCPSGKSAPADSTR